MNNINSGLGSNQWDLNSLNVSENSTSSNDSIASSQHHAVEVKSSKNESLQEMKDINALGKSVILNKSDIESEELSNIQDDDDFDLEDLDDIDADSMDLGLSEMEEGIVNLEEGVANIEEAVVEATEGNQKEEEGIEEKVEVAEEKVEVVEHKIDEIVTLEEKTELKSELIIEDRGSEPVPEHNEKLESKLASVAKNIIHDSDNGISRTVKDDISKKVETVKIANSNIGKKASARLSNIYVQISGKKVLATKHMETKISNGKIQNKEHIRKATDKLFSEAKFYKHENGQFIELTDDEMAALKEEFHSHAQAFLDEHIKAQEEKKSASGEQQISKHNVNQNASDKTSGPKKQENVENKFLVSLVFDLKSQFIKSLHQVQEKFNQDYRKMMRENKEIEKQDYLNRQIIALTYKKMNDLHEINEFFNEKVTIKNDEIFHKGIQYLESLINISKEERAMIERDAEILASPEAKLSKWSSRHSITNKTSEVNAIAA